MVRIYGTIGPACRDSEILTQMFKEGMDGVRLNLSHTTLEKASDLIESCREAARACGKRPELLIDMQGPELRIGSLKEPVRLNEGDLLLLEGEDLLLAEEGDQLRTAAWDVSMIEARGKDRNKTRCADKNETRCTDRIHFPEIAVKALKESGSGQKILLDDGKILLEMLAPDGSSSDKTLNRQDTGGIYLRVVRGGVLESRKSVALPGCSIKTPAMTENDIAQISKAKEFGVTAVMQPFVRSKEDLIEVRRALDKAGCGDIRLLAKIENRDGISRLEELIPYCDEIVIARGDLGNAMDLWDLPAAQKHISAVCRREGRDFMVVTQMLDSMMHRQVPTRAEVSDIFNAVLDGAASVMVTGETAAGEYPLQVIRYLYKTVKAAEAFRTE